MKNAPNIYKLKDLVKGFNEIEIEVDGKWVPARPMGYYSIRRRMRAAWLVFTGRADAVVWPGDQ